jgi:ankyrin repeat protein
MASIFKVIRDNDIQLLNYLIDSSTGDQHHNTYNNILKQDIQFIQQQLKNSGSKYYDLNRRSVNGRTALHCAVTWNRVEMAQALIDCPNVNINLRDRENGWTALHRYYFIV